jgi:serine/threonine protein kinase
MRRRENQAEQERTRFGKAASVRNFRQYVVEERVGKGSFGIVVRAVNLTLGETVAVKIFDKVR